MTQSGERQTPNLSQNIAIGVGMILSAIAAVGTVEASASFERSGVLDRTPDINIEGHNTSIYTRLGIYGATTTIVSLLAFRAGFLACRDFNYSRFNERNVIDASLDIEDQIEHEVDVQSDVSNSFEVGSISPTPRLVGSRTSNHARIEGTIIGRPIDHHVNNVTIGIPIHHEQTSYSV